MSALIELYPGGWVRPERVMSVTAYGERRISDTLTISPSVKVHVVGTEPLGWEFETWEAAAAWANMIAAKINGQVDG